MLMRHQFDAGEIRKKRGTGSGLTLKFLLLALSLVMPAPVVAQYAAAQSAPNKVDACNQMELNLDNNDPERPGLVQAETLFNEHVAQLQQRVKIEELTLGSLYEQYMLVQRGVG